MSKIEFNKLEKRRLLLNAAHKLFSEKGFAKTAISDIVEKAGVAKGTFYLYFKDKYDIKDQLVLHSTRELFASSISKLKKSGLNDPDECFLYMINATLDLLCRNRPLLILINKNLNPGLFEKVLEGDELANDVKYLTSFDYFKKKVLCAYRDPELLSYMIMEFVGSTAFSSILDNDPIPIDILRPHILDAAKQIIISHRIDPGQSENL